MNQQLIALALTQVMPTVVASGLMVSTCTIQAPTPAGLAPSGTYADVSGLVDIQCMDAPKSTAGSAFAVDEFKGNNTESQAERHVLLDSYYDQLSPNTNWGNIGWRAVVTNSNDGTSQTYDIQGAEADSQHTQTRLQLRKITL